MIPDLPDILSSVRDYLRVLAPTLSGAQKYDAQIGAFLLDMAVREVEDGGAVEARSRSRLSTFMGADTPAAQFCAAIRSGALDARWDETLALVLAETTDQLRLVRPDHLAPEHAEETCS